MKLGRDINNLRNEPHASHSPSFSILLFSAILQNCFYDKIGFSYLVFLIDLVLSVFTISLGFAKYSPRKTVYNKDSLLFFITPTIFSTETWLSISLAVMLLFIVVFTFCVKINRLCSSFHLLLNPNIHILLLPFLSHNYAHIWVNSDSGYIVIYSIIFLLYLFFMSYLFYVHTNSIIRPNPIYHEWFSGSNFFYPLFIAFSNIFFLLSGQVSKEIHFALMAICALASAAYAFFIIRKMPYILLFTNDIIASKYLCLFLYSIMSIIVGDSYLGNRALIPLPVIYIILILILKLIADKRRLGIHKVLSQIDSSFRRYSVEELSTALSSIVKSETDVQWVIKEGIISGNKSVVNKEFIHFCLKKFKKSRWFVNLVPFFIELNWECDRSATYKVLLHLLSLHNSLFSSLQLFQIIYIMNQNSDSEQSIIISRHIEKYRISLRNFSEKHQKFWLAVMQDDEIRFRKSLRDLYAAMRDQTNIINSLVHRYEFSPLVHLHASLYYSDIVQNYVKSGKHFQKAVLLKTKKDQYISSEIFNEFSCLLPGMNRVLPKNSKKRTINFLSVRTSHDTALRSQPEISLNDDFLEALCQTYSIPVNTAKHKILPFAAKTLTVFKVVFFFLSLFMAYFLVLIEMQYSVFSTEQSTFNDRIDLITNTIEFRWHLTAASLDLRLLVNIVNETYQNFSNESLDFYYFVVEHLQDITFNLVRYQYQINKIRILNDDSFSQKFGELHQYCAYFIQTQDISNLMKTVSDTTLDNLVNPLEHMSEELYQNFTRIEIESENNVCSYLQYEYISSISVTLSVALFSIAFFVISTSSIEKSLFRILKSVQSVVISEIQQKFSKLIDIEKENRNIAKFHSRGFLIFSIVAMSICSISYPIHNLCLLILNPKSNFGKLPLFMNITSDIETIYYTLALTQLNLNYQKSSYHKFAEVKCPNCVKVARAIKYKFNPLILSMLLIVYLFFFGMFIVELLNAIKMYQSVQILLKFIPTHASESNPILSSLWNGQALSKKDVTQFNSMLLNEIENPSFFCVLYFNESDEVEETVGNIVDILHCSPETLWQLTTYVKENSEENVNLIDEFFAQRKNMQTCSISLGPFHEVSLTFSQEGRALTIKDDGHHYLRNQQMRSIMNANITEMQRKNLQNENPQTIESCIVVCCASDLSKEEKRGQIFFFVGKNDNVFFLLCRIECVDNLVKLIKDKADEKIVAHSNGRVFMIKKSKISQPPKLFGKVIDEAKLLMKLGNEADFIVTKNFWMLTQSNEIQYDVVKLSTDSTLEIHRFVRNIYT